MSTINCVLVGGGSVLTRCGEIILARGHRIRAVVTDEPAARAWAVKSGIPHHRQADAAAAAPQLACDLLLSIGNYALVPDALLACAGRMSINYHYGPLPEYAGLHAPSWAVAERATDYAVSWHRIGELIDGGEVLKRVPVPLRSDETALSLGLKCDEAAVAGLAELIDEIAEGRESGTPQDLAARRYFSRHSQFAAEGVIDWADDSEHIVAMVRATDYGPFSSPLVWPKVIVGGQVLAVREAHSGAASEGARPGEVIACDGTDGLRVATGSGSVRLTGLTTLEGDRLALGDLAAGQGAQPGTVLPAPGAGSGLTEAGTTASKSASYWRTRLIDGDPCRLPYSLPESESLPESGTGAEADGSAVTARFRPADGELEQPAAASRLAAVWCTFIGRATAKQNILIALTAPARASTPATATSSPPGCR
ncbi:hypothetical protein GXW82_31195 [Streptacidiphilus sp. 4-A2]|nr:hypothetical protein [Streptacidiphilus sp. 4-A2]